LQTSQTKDPKFEAACGDAVGRLRSALVELYESVGADPANPQAVARKFGLNKTLTWNVSRILQAPTSVAAIPHVPGVQSIEKLVRATQGNGASGAVVEDVRAAALAFEEVIEIHVGDRATLDLVLDGFESSDSSGLELSRKLGFRGNSGICGVQARTRLMCCFLAPAADDPARLDMAMVSGYVGFRRLRSPIEWPIFKVRQWSDVDEPLATQRWAPIESPESDQSGSQLLTQFSRGAQPEINVVSTNEGLDYMLQPGPIGNAGAFDCFRGEVLRSAVGRYKTSADETGEFGVNITSPAEHLVFDLLVHKDLAFALSAKPLVFGRISPQGERTGGPDDPSLLPIRPTISELVGTPPAVATPLVPRYSDLVRVVCKDLGWDSADLRGIRLQLRFPPLNSAIVLRFGLPDA
jgi:hypothetical protein